MKISSIARLLLLEIVVFCFLQVASVFPQRINISGIVRDELSLAPIGDVNITINGTKQGAVSDKSGRFSLILEKIPAAVTLSYVGYETVFFDIVKFSPKPLEMIMRPKVYSLREVEIPAKKFNYIFRDLDYSVLDYEILDDNLLLLIFRYQLKRCELIMLTLEGDTLIIAQVPELKPKCLYKDFLGHVHYISTLGNAFQCYHDDSLKQFGFTYQTTFDSLRMISQPFLFSAADRVYFQEYTPDGFGKNIGYYDKEHHKEYIRFMSGETTRKKYNDDLTFYSRWNNQLESTDPNSPARVTGDEIRANKLFNYQKINAPFVKLGETNMAVFIFSEDVIELMDPKGKVYRKVPITFHKELEENLLASIFTAIVPVPEWKWRGKILADEYYRNVYAVFTKNGMVQIRKIDLETGNLTRSYDLPFPFPEKIQIYKGDAYFLIKTDGSDNNWKLGKYKL
jgi:hypothetical protein